MNEVVLEVVRDIASISAMIVLCCGLTVCLACLDNDDNNNNNNDHPTHHPGRRLISFHGIKAAGVNPSVLRSIPVVAFTSRDFNDVVECVVCLSDLVHGDKARVLPSCNHWFHADCIDTWFQSDSTCPICRKHVGGIRNLDPVYELPLRTVAVSGEAYEARRDVTAVVIDIPAEPAIGEDGPIKASDLDQL